MKPLLNQLADAAKLVVMPWRLAPVATEATSIPSAAIAVLSSSAGASAAVSVGLAATVEPFTNLTKYFWEGISAIPAMTLLAIIPSTVIVAGIMRDARTSPRAMGPRARARHCAVLLSPTIVFLPLAVWGLCLGVVEVRDPGFGLGVPKPSWIHWLIFDIALVGLPAIALGMLTVGLPAAFRTFQSLPETSEDDTCPRCRYSLRGLPQDSPCPECGHKSAI